MRVAPISQLTSTLREYYEEKRALLRGRLSEHVRPRALSRLLERAEVCEPRAGVALHHAQREGDPRARRPLDGRVRVHDRPAAARHDRAEPSPQASRARAGKRRCCSTSPACSPCAPCTSSTADGSRFRYERQAPPTERRRLRVLVLLETGYKPPDDLESLSEQERHDFKTETDVLTTLERTRSRGAGARDQARARRRSGKRWRSGSRTSSST